MIPEALRAIIQCNILLFVIFQKHTIGNDRTEVFDWFIIDATCILAFIHHRDRRLSLRMTVSTSLVQMRLVCMHV